MTKEELKALGLTDEQVNAISEDYGKNYVSKGQFNEKNEEAKNLKSEIENARKDLDNLRKSNKDNEELTKQIEELKTNAKQRDTEYEKQLRDIKLSGALDIALLNAKGKNSKAIKALLNLDNAEILDDGTIKGLDEQLKTLQKSDPYLFGEVSPKGHVPGDPGEDTPKTVTAEQFKKMTLQEKQDLYLNDRTTYDAVTKGD